MSHFRSRNAKSSLTRADSRPPTCTAISTRYIGCSPNRHGSHRFALGSAKRTVMTCSAPPPSRKSRRMRSGEGRDRSHYDLDLAVHLAAVEVAKAGFHVEPPGPRLERRLEPHPVHGHRADVLQLDGPPQSERHLPSIR